MAEELKFPIPRQCPFCADVRSALVIDLNKEVGISSEEDPAFALECACCGARGPMGGTQEGAWRLWNARYSGTGEETAPHWRDDFAKETA